MKKITNLLMLFAVAMCVACDEPIELPEPLKVTPFNLDGVWKLSEQSGSPLAENTYVYVVLDSKHTFQVYDNMNSGYPVLSTGTYALEYDWRVGDVISGVYDHQLGAWGHEYIITDLYGEKSMVWTAKDDSTYVQKYEWVDEVPSHIVEAVRK
jgi:hypothetical protein